MKKRLTILIIVFFIFVITVAIVPNIYSATIQADKNSTNCAAMNQTCIPFDGTSDSVYHVTGNLTLSGNNTGTNTGVVFITGDLNINSNYTYGSSGTAVAPLIGAVFVVSGNVNIHRDVTRIDAVIISEGIICTAFDGTSCPSSNIQTSQLIINGSLISLNEEKPVEFRRTLADNSQAAEKINHQVKYLVILRNLISDTWQKWSEIP